ncbi:peptidase [Cellulomonas sp. PhB150]|uniref:peptidase n=1 Tax=Cellulomonas sp. PhB150 TaxID=2485188 RepID=UPI0011CE4169|nr:peptidase [Cellulomonas sp. PhB150]
MYAPPTTVQTSRRARHGRRAGRVTRNSVGASRRPAGGIRQSAGYQNTLVLFVVVAFITGAWLKYGNTFTTHTPVGAPVDLGGINVPVSPAPGAPPTATTIPENVRSAMGFPTPGFEAGTVPLGHPPLVGSVSSSYKFLHVQADGITPVSWDPCRPIHYVTRTAGAPPGGNDMIEAAVSAVSAASGLVFVNDGATDESDPLRSMRPLSQPALYGDRWAPVLIEWDTEAQNMRLAGNIAGVGGPTPVSIDGQLLVNVTGGIQLDVEQVMDAQAYDGQGVTIVMHELAHLVGLDHVADPTQIMNPSAMPGVNTFQAGDLTGLALLGKGTCDPRF